MFDPQVAASVARMLTLMSDPPNERSHPAPGDLAGDFSRWFDGGAVRHDTGISSYRFEGDAAATTGTNPGFSTVLRLSDGRLVEVREKAQTDFHPTDLVGLD